MPMFNPPHPGLLIADILDGSQEVNSVTALASIWAPRERSCRE